MGVIRVFKERSTLLIRFENKVFYSPDGCWYWISNVDNHGYGKIRVGDGFSLAHRISYQIYKGEIPDKMCVCHTCDNPICVNPNHLWLGTPLDNIRDRTIKNRTARNFGIKQGNTVLTDEKVIQLREMRSDANNTVAKLAHIFNCSKGAISAALDRRTWKHI